MSVFKDVWPRHVAMTTGGILLVMYMCPPIVVRYHHYTEWPLVMYLCPPIVVRYHHYTELPLVMYLCPPIVVRYHHYTEWPYTKAY